jgi:hypothetical protein
MFIVNQTSNFRIFMLHSNEYWIVVRKAKIINGNRSGKLGGGIFYTTDFE